MRCTPQIVFLLPGVSSLTKVKLVVATVVAMSVASRAMDGQVVTIGYKGPDVPTLLNAWVAQVDATTLRFAWNQLGTTGDYTISCEIGTRPRRTVGTIALGIPAKTGSLPRRASYVFRINEFASEHRCFLQWKSDAKGELSPGIPFNVVTPIQVVATEKPPAPSVTARASAANEITVTWTAVPNATAYSIGRSVAPYGFTVFCDLCPATTTVLDKNVSAGAKHAYIVTPISPGGALPRGTSNTVVGVSSTDEIVIASDPAVSSDLRKPGGVTAAVNSATTVSVKWQAVDLAEGYDVYRAVNGGALQLLGHVKNGPGGSEIEFADYLGGMFTVGVTEVVAIYAVKSTDGAGHATEAEMSNKVQLVAKAVVATGTSTNATNAKAVATSINSVTLTWSPPAGSVQCSLRRSLDGGAFAALPPIKVGASSYVDTADDLMAHRPRYQIICNTGKSALAAVAFTNPQWDIVSPPISLVSSTGLTAANLKSFATSADAVTLTWGPPTSPIACTVQRSLDGAPYTWLQTLAVGAFRYVDSMAGLMSKRPRYRLACGDAKTTALQFPDPQLK